MSCVSVANVLLMSANELLMCCYRTGKSLAITTALNAPETSCHRLLLNLLLNLGRGKLHCEAFTSWKPHLERLQTASPAVA